MNVKLRGCPSQATLKKLFDYKNGELIWKESTSNRVKAGDVAGHRSKTYIQLAVNGRLHPAHRIIWLWHFGYMPENGIDHINRNKKDNRIENLREVSRKCNARNSGNPSTNTSGVKGVCYNRREQVWTAYIQDEGVRSHLGNYPNIIEAACARLAAEQCLGWPGCDSDSPANNFVKKCLYGRECDLLAETIKRVMK